MSKVVTSGIKYNTQATKKRFTRNQQIFAQSRWEQAGTHAKIVDYNVSSYSDNGAGQSTVNYSTAKTDYYMPDVVKSGRTHCAQGTATRSTSACDMVTATHLYTPTDSNECVCAAWGYPA